MSETFLKNLSIRVVVALGVMACSSMASGQALPAASDPAAAAAEKAKAYASDAKGYAIQVKNYFADRRQVALSLTYEDAGANLTYANPISFQSQGGGAELSFQFRCV